MPRTPDDGDIPVSAGAAVITPQRRFTRAPQGSPQVFVNAIGASFDEILAPQVNVDSEIVDRIRRLVPQCNRRDQELLLALIDKMLDTKENNANK